MASSGFGVASGMPQGRRDPVNAGFPACAYPATADGGRARRSTSSLHLRERTRAPAALRMVARHGTPTSRIRAEPEQELSFGPPAVSLYLCRLRVNDTRELFRCDLYLPWSMSSWSFFHCARRPVHVRSPCVPCRAVPGQMRRDAKPANSSGYDGESEALPGAIAGGKGRKRSRLRRRDNDC